MSGSEVKARRLAVAVFGCCWLYLAFPWLSGRVTIPYDAKALFQAQLQFLATALHSGQSPFWNPYTFAGFPQIADPQSLIFSPALLIAYFFEAPNYSLLDTYVMVLLLAGGLATLFLCLDFKWHPAAGVVAAIVFAFGGSAAWRIQHIGHIQAYAFFAISLWCFLRALSRRSVIWGLCAGAAAGVMLAEPNQVALLGGYALAFVYIGQIAAAARSVDEVKSTWRAVLAAGASGLALAVIPVALTHMFLQQSNRPVVDIAEAARGSLHPVSLLTFAIADLFGALDPKVDYWGPYSEHWNRNELTLSQNMSQVYFGMLPALLLLIFGFVRRHVFDREVRIFSFIAFGSVLYALGAYTPVYAALHSYAPGVHAFRRPVDATFIAGGMVAILSGYFVHLWLTGQSRVTSRGREAFAIFVIAAVIATACGVALWAGKLDVALKPVLASFVWLGLSALLLRPVGGVLKRNAALLTIGPALLLSVDIGIHNAANASTGVEPKEVADVLQPRTKNDTIAFLKSRLRNGTGSPWRDRVEMLGLGFDWQNCGEVHRFESTLGYNPFRIGLVSQALGAKDYNVGPDQRTFSPLFPSYNSVLADMIGIRFVASSAPLERIDARLRPGDVTLVARTKDAFIYENPGVLPRAYLVGAARVADFDSILRTGRWPDFDPRTTVLLQAREIALEHWAAAGDALAAESMPLGGAIVRRYENDVIEIATDAGKASILVLNDIWHPWWFASIDGADTRVVRANGIFRAVEIPPGKHTVTFTFRPFYGASNQIMRWMTSG